MPLSKEQRLCIIFEVLSGAPCVETADEAYQLLCRTIDEVEDAHSGVKYDADGWEDDGRIYPPQPDSARPARERPWITVYRSKGHRTFIASNGALEITLLGEQVVFSKLGKDGLSVAESLPSQG